MSNAPSSRGAVGPPEQGLGFHENIRPVSTSDVTTHGVDAFQRDSIDIDLKTPIRVEQIVSRVRV